jgi:diguanylate cyclase (GGDEF)-like protein
VSAESFAELRREFVLGSLDRLDRMEALLGRLRRAPADAEPRHDLLVQFHGLAGSGTSYGFPELTRIGALGERRLRELEAGEQAVDAADVARLLELVAEARRALEAEGEPVAAFFDVAPQTTSASVDALVVEDDPGVRALLAGRLQAEGYAVRTAGSLAEAQAALVRGLPDALVVDVELPDGSGYALVEGLRRRPQGELAAVVVATARGDFLDKVEAIHSGADGFFPKPVDWDLLVARLRHLVDGQRQTAARVLCVEDFPEQAAFVRSVLAAAGYEVRVCADPREFGAAVLEQRPDLVLMDILLPGVSGYDLTRYLRQDPRHATLPVVFLTSQLRDEARIEGLRAGGDDYLVKPVTPALLLTSVAAHLERARLLAGLIERDALTQLLSHTGVYEALRAALRGERAAGPLAFALLDLDALRAVNLRLGYRAGDQLIVELAALLRRRLRPPVAAGRVGGGSFGLVLEGLDKAEAARLVSRLREEFAAAERRASDGSRFRATFCAGVALREAGQDAEALQRAAADALALAKRQGPNRVSAGAALY